MHVKATRHAASQQRLTLRAAQRHWTPDRADLLAALAGSVWGACWIVPWLAPLFPAWFVLLFIALERVDTGRKALRLGAISATMQYVVGAHFLLALAAVSPLGVVIFLIAVVYSIPFSAGAAWLAWRFERKTGIARQLAFVALFPIVEWLHAASSASLPADLCAHGFGGLPRWLAMSAWTGPWGPTLWAGTVGWLLWTALRSRRHRIAVIVAIVVVYAMPLAASLIVPPRPGSGPPFKVAIIQPSLTLAQKLDPAHAQEAWARIENLTRRAAKGVDLVVWGETQRPGAVTFHDDEPFHDPEVERIASAVGVPILYGAVLAELNPSGEKVDALFNGAALARPDGRPGAWYGKQQLVPFAEGLPFASLIGYQPKEPSSRKRGWITLLGNFSPGPEPTIFEVGAARIGVLVCYEGLYPQYAREYRQRGANLLAVLVNDAWWKRTFFSPWHARMLAARAIENQVPVIRAGNSGVSCAMESDGRMTARSDIFTVVTLEGETRLAGGDGTLYTRAGDWLLVVLVVLLGGVLVFKRAVPDTRTR